MKISKEITRVIEDRMRLYENTYQIEVLFWSFRGSVDVGIYRKNSDLDIIFVYRSKNKNLKAIHEIVGHGFDYWGWLLEDVITTIEESNKECETGATFVLSKEHERASMDYYYGIYCVLGNECAYITDVFLKKCMRSFRELFNKKAAIVCLNAKLEKCVIKIKKQQELKGAEFLNAVWYALMCRHLTKGQAPGDNKLNKLLNLYASPLEKHRISYVHSDYKMSVSKTAKSYADSCVYKMLLEQYELNNAYIASEENKEQMDDCEKYIEYLKAFAFFEDV